MRPVLFCFLFCFLFAFVGGCGAGVTPPDGTGSGGGGGAGGGGGGNGLGNGLTVGDVTLTPRSTIWASKESMTTPWILPLVHIVDFENACGVFPSDCSPTTEPSENVMLSFYLYTQNPGPGTYDVGTFDEDTTPASARVAGGGIRHNKDGSAVFTSKIAAGNVIVDRYDDTTLAGEYTFTFDTGETRQGTFEATFCQGLDTVLACQ